MVNSEDLSFTLMFTGFLFLILSPDNNDCNKTQNLFIYSIRIYYYTLLNRFELLHITEQVELLHITEQVELLHITEQVELLHITEQV